jgi:flagellar hook protein FlgE
MSLYGALLTGVSGLDANSRALGITSSNIANVNTVGFKASSAAFSTFLASSGGGDVGSSSVQVKAMQQLQQQGLLTTTGSATDLAISGNGFFIVTDDPTTPTSTLYTRAGAFAPDSNGFLRNSAGYYLEGWTLNPDGTMPANRSSLSAIDLSTLNGTAKPTENLNLRANLQSSATAVGAYAAGDMFAGTVTPEFEQTVNIFDSQGGSRPFKLSFAKTAANTWAYEVSYQGPIADIGAGNNPVATGTVTFNDDGTLATPAGGTATVTVPWVTAQTGLASQAMSLRVGTAGESDGLMQFDSASALLSANADGAPFGALTSVSIDEQGYVTALFDNGIQRKVFKLPVATFANPNGLNAAPGNAYSFNEQSGLPIVLEAKTGGAGTISARSLEASTVDLAKEFSDLITTQRAYSAATRIVTTADDMLQELMQIKR